MDDFKIVKQIGRGAFGVVYMAEHIRTHEKVAIKSLDLTDKQVLSNFLFLSVFSAMTSNTHSISTHAVGQAVVGVGVSHSEGLCAREHCDVAEVREDER